MLHGKRFSPARINIFTIEFNCVIKKRQTESLIFNSAVILGNPTKRYKEKKFPFMLKYRFPKLNHLFI